MALADFTKQIAKEALLGAATPAKDAPTPAPAVENVGSAVVGQIAAMQKQLKEDEELVVTFQQGTERIRVMEIFLASPSVIVLIGPDANRVATRVIAAAPALHLICKTAKVPAGAKAARIGLTTAKAKP